MDLRPETKAMIGFSELTEDDLGANFTQKFALMREIGRGSFGVVVLAQNKETMAQCAVKVLQLFKWPCFADYKQRKSPAWANRKHQGRIRDPEVPRA